MAIFQTKITHPTHSHAQAACSARSRLSIKTSDLRKKLQDKRYEISGKKKARAVNKINRKNNGHNSRKGYSGRELLYFQQIGIHFVLA